jgi:hypothetical protein
MPVCCEKEELLNAVVFPLRQEFVQSSVKSFSLQAGRTGVTFILPSPHPELEGRSPKYAAPFRYPTGYSLGDESVRAQREVGPVLSQGPRREDQPRVSGEGLLHLGPGEFGKRP